MLTAVLAVSGFSACQDDIDAPGMKVPVATLQANTTIAELKQKYWNSADNYIDQIKLNDAGEHVVIAGRVISSDAAGNIFKSLVIQDATGALSMSINAYNLYTDYRVGQEIVLDLTEMYIGKYSTLQQLGFPDYSAAYGWQASFMPLEFFKEHAQVNGLPEPAKVDTLVINIPTDNSEAALMKYQSQLVRLNNVYFVDGGEASFCTAHKVSYTNRTVKDDNGNEIVVRTSGYANFWSTKLPAEHGDIVGILSTYKSSGEYKWQLQLRSTDDLLNFGNPTLPKGTEDNPYNILEAIQMIADDSAVSGWYTGYIVGSLRAGVSSVESADDIIWGTDAEVNNTLIIGQTPTSNTLEDCIVIRLPQGSALREYGNLRDVPENYGKQIWLLGTPAKDLNMDALTGNTGTASEFRIEGVTVPGGDDTSGEPVPEGNGTETSPYNPTQVLAMGKSVNETGKWVSGYIVGFVPEAKIPESVFTVPATNASNVLLATSPDEKDYNKCLPIQLLFGTDARTALNLMDNPSNLGKLASVHGDLIAYFGVAGVKNTDQYKLEGGGSGDNPNPPAGTVVTSFNETFDDATAFPTASGWTIAQTSGNAAWFIRKADANNPTNCAEITAYGSGKNPGADNQFVSWMISPGLNVDGMTSKTLTFKSKVGYKGQGTLEVYALSSADPATATKTKLNATVAQPSGSWSEFVESGNVSLASLSGTVYIGFCYTAAKADGYTTYRVEDIVAGAEGTGGGDEPTPPTPPVTEGNTVNFNTFNEGVKSSAYIENMTSTGGWVAKWCGLAIGGGDNANSATYSFLPDADTFALVIDGSIARQGSLTSPTLTGGVKTLSLNYGFAFNETKAAFTVNIKQGGEVKATKTETIESITKNQVYTFSMDANVSGEFVIEILNNAYSAATKGNKDRVAIWNLKWENM